MRPLLISALLGLAVAQDPPSEPLDESAEGVIEGAEPEVAPQPAPGSVLLTNARLIEAAGVAPREGVAILVIDGEIAGVHEGDEAPLAEEVIDLEGATVVPGLVDSHVHATFLQGSPFRELSPEEEDLRVQRQLRAYLAAGVTTVLDACSEPEHMAEMQGWLEDGLAAPRVLSLAFPPGMSEGYIQAVLPNAPAQDTPEEVAAYIRTLEGSDNVGLKFAVEGGPVGNIWDIPEADYLAAVAETSAEVGLPLYVHAMAAEETAIALTMQPHALVHGVRDNDPEVIAAVAEQSPWVIMTVVISDNGLLIFDEERLADPLLQSLIASWDLEGLTDPELREESLVAIASISMDRGARFIARRERLQVRVLNTVREEHMAAAAALYEAGVPLIVGSDTPAWPAMFSQVPGYSTIREMELLGEIGMSPEEVLAAATTQPAAMLGLEDELGRIEAGRSADLVVLDADPLSSPSAFREVRYVMRAGELRTPEDWLAAP